MAKSSLAASSLASSSSSLWRGLVGGAGLVGAGRISLLGIGLGNRSLIGGSSLASHIHGSSHIHGTRGGLASWFSSSTPFSTSAESAASDHHSRLEGGAFTSRVKGKAHTLFEREFLDKYPDTSPELIQQAEARVFGNFINETQLRTGRKVVKGYLKYQHYYDSQAFPDLVKYSKHPMYRDPLTSFDEEQREDRRRRGKVKPKKGEGKRAQMTTKGGKGR
ncbi:ribosomal protein S33 [Pseudoscourfieldia marina]